MGAASGYFIATLCGVLGGNFFARMISPRVISIAGGVLFLLFALQILIMKDSCLCYKHSTKRTSLSSLVPSKSEMTWTLLHIDSLCLSTDARTLYCMSHSPHY